MATFLSPAWLESLAAAAQASGDVGRATAGVVLTLQHVVTGAPGGDNRYWVRIEHGSVTTGVGDATAPDVTFTEDYATAAALCRGELNAQSAMLAGGIRAAGNIGLLIEHRGALSGLDHVFAELRRETVYPG